MTRDEFLKEYGNVPLKLHSYYKYSFTFKGMTQNDSYVTMCLGGDADDIYRLELDVESTYYVRDLDYANYGSVEAPDGTLVADFSEY